MFDALATLRAVRTIEEIRLANYQRLLKELAGPDGVVPNDPAVAAALGLSKVYVWQLRKGERKTIESAAARKMEINTDKPVGWMDNDPECWPFPDIDYDQFYKLDERQRLEIQGAVRNLMLNFVTVADSRKKRA